MTKTIKRCLCAILLFGFMIASAFSALGFRNAFADLTDEDKDNFVAQVKLIVDKADSNEDGELSDAEIRTKKGTYDVDFAWYQLYNIASNKGTTGIDEDYVGIYEHITTVYNENKAVDLYSGLTSYCVFVIDKDTGYSYTASHAQIEEYRGIYNAIRDLGAEDLAFLHNLIFTPDWTKEDVDGVGVDLDVPVNLVNAEAQIDAWYVSIKAAITAINKIQVRVNDGGLVLKDLIAAITAGNVYEYVLDSETAVAGSINAAVAAYNAVSNDDKPSVENYALLTAAQEGLAAQKKKITDVETEINNIYTNKYSTAAGAEVCWSIKDEIGTANTHYNNLDATSYNNLKAVAAASVGTKLTAMLDMLSKVETYIGVVNDKIEAIGDVVYTTTSINKINNAKNANNGTMLTTIDGEDVAMGFDQLPNDVKVHDAAETAPDTYYVVKYPVLVKAINDFAALQAKVDNLVKAISELPAVELLPELFTKYNTVVSQITGIVADGTNSYNQLNGDGADLVGVWASPLDETVASPEAMAKFATAKAAYDYFTTIVTKINTTAGQIRDKINALTAVALTDDFDAALATITEMLVNNGVIDADATITIKDDQYKIEVLDDRYTSAIGNSVFNKYLEKRYIYEQLIAKVNAWADKVALIPELVTVNSFAEVKDAVDALLAIVNNGLSENADVLVQYTEGTLETALNEFNKQYNEKAVKAYYALYKAAVDRGNEIVGKLDDAKAKALELVRPGVIGTLKPKANPDDPDEYFTAADYANYKTALGFATVAYNALDAYDASVDAKITKAYFKTHVADDVLDIDYKTGYEAYANALIFDAANDVELKINKITANSAESVDYITQARGACDALISTFYPDAEEDEIETIKAELVRNYAVLTAVEEKLATFKANVDKLLKGAKIKIEDGKIVTDEDGKTVYVDATADDVVVAAVTQDNIIDGFYKVNVTVAKNLWLVYNNDYTNVEKAYAGVGDQYTLLVNMRTIAGINDGVLGNKLDYIDTQLGEYVIAYNNGVPTVGRYEQLKEIVAALDDSQIALLVNYSDFEQIERDNLMAEELAQAIVALYSEVQVEINYNSLIEYHLVAAIYKGLNGSQKVLVNENVAKLNERASLAAIDAKLVEAGINPSDTMNVVEQMIADAIAASLDAEAEEGNVIYKAIVSAIAASLTTVDGVDGNVKAAIVAALDSAEDYADDILVAAKDYAKNYADDILVAAKDYAKNYADDILVAAKDYAKNYADDILVAAKDYAKNYADDILVAAKTYADGKAAAALADAKAYADEKIAAEKAAREAADAALEGKINTETENRDKAIADLQAQIDALQTKTLVIIIVFAVISAALCACVVVLFVKGKKA